MYFIHQIWLNQFWSDFVDSIRCYDNGEDAIVFLGATFIHNSIETLSATHNPEKKKIIAYQTEPLVDNHWWKPEVIIKNLQGADEVWDYDLDNIEILKSHGIDAKYKPPKYSENLCRVVNNLDPEISVLFYGTLTEYRAKFLYDMLHGSIIYDRYSDTFAKMNFVTVWNVTGPELDKYIANSKIILNLNPYDGETRQQQPRISYALNNGKCVISQKSNRNYFGDLITEFDSIQSGIDAVLKTLSDETWKDPTIRYRYKSFST